MNDAFEAITQVLHDLRLSGSFYCRSELAAPWGLEMPAWKGVHFHFVAQGRCWLEAAETGETLLEAGDLVLLPHGRGHRLAFPRSTTARPVRDLPHEDLGQHASVLRYGGAGEEALLICGGVQIEPRDHPLVQLLPELLLVRGQDGRSEGWVEVTLQLMALEARRPGPGTATVITRLSDILVILAVRHWLQTAEEGRAGWLGALRDRRIGKALALIHRHVERPWTVAGLAEAVDMSRASFSERFTRLVGIPPLQYVRRWRMHVAGEWIRDQGLTVEEAAHRLNYASGASFSRAFKRHRGVPPGSLRRAGGRHPVTG